MPWLRSSFLLLVLLAPGLDVFALRMHRFYATTVSGLEDVLKQEVLLLRGAVDVKKTKLGVKFGGTSTTGFDAVINLRSALKVLEEVAHADGISSSEDLYAFSRDAVPWEDVVLDPESQTLKVEARLGDVGPELAHSHFSAVTVQKGICDRLLGKKGTRPNISKVDEDMSFLVYLHKNTATLYRSWSGANSLHKRGYRQGAPVHVAALRETTAAGLLLAAGYNSGDENDMGTWVDPMCGSASFGIEAALIACGTAPGLLRLSRRGLPQGLRYADLDEAAFNEAYEMAVSRDQRRNKKGIVMLCSDVSPAALQLARHGAASAGVDHLLRFECADVESFKPQEMCSVVITNPPWDLRLQDDAPMAWEKLGCWFLSQERSQNLWVLAGNPKLPSSLNLGRPQGFFAVNAANVDMRLLQYVKS